jgi:ActR/RegA family two-component response regulator
MFRESGKEEILVSPDFSSSKVSGGALLIVEDYERIRIFFARHFEKKGFRVYSAARIPDAVAIAHSVLPNVILVDYDLERENAIDAVKKLHHIVPGARIVVFGGVDSAEIRKQVVAQGGTDFVPHGYDIENLDNILLQSR